MHFIVNGDFFFNTIFFIMAKKIPSEKICQETKGSIYDIEENDKYFKLIYLLKTIQ